MTKEQLKKAIDYIQSKGLSIHNPETADDVVMYTVEEIFSKSEITLCVNSSEVFNRPCAIEDHSQAHGEGKLQR